MSQCQSTQKFSYLGFDAQNLFHFVCNSAPQSFFVWLASPGTRGVFPVHLWRCDRRAGVIRCWCLALSHPLSPSPQRASQHPRAHSAAHRSPPQLGLASLDDVPKGQPLVETRLSFSERSLRGVLCTSGVFAVGSQSVPGSPQLALFQGHLTGSDLPGTQNQPPLVEEVCWPPGSGTPWSNEVSTSPLCPTHSEVTKAAIRKGGLSFDMVIQGRQIPLTAMEVAVRAGVA